jgi:hypothetical protein
MSQPILELLPPKTFVGQSINPLHESRCCLNPHLFGQIQGNSRQIGVLLGDHITEHVHPFFSRNTASRVLYSVIKI